MCNLRHEPSTLSHPACCPAAKHPVEFDADRTYRPDGLNRRQFMAATGIATAAGLTLPALVNSTLGDLKKTRRQQPVFRSLRIQPVFNCEIYQRKPTTSWRWTGAIQSEQQLREEEHRIRRDLEQMASSADFALEIRPLVTVRNVEQAAAVTKKDYDVLIMYAARRTPKVLEAMASPDRWNLIFVRHRSGPLYYMYIGAHTHFLRKTRDEFGQPGMDVHDIVVDDHAELLWRLRAFYGLKNILGKRIVAVGGAGAWGVGGRGAPDRAEQRWKLDIVPVSYSELGERIKKIRQNKTLVNYCHNKAEEYLKQENVVLETSNAFAYRAFILCEVFRDLLDEAQTDAITVKSCMSTIMPISETTACLPLSLLNDDGYMAFCESDFVVIPSGILLRYISGKPVFLCNPSLPHDSMLTVSHCTAPRRMNGKELEPARILTHYESDFGAAPKVEMRKGQEVTVLNPDFAGR
ncbi:MAG: twin-arginine translocation signal domain-containing protein, partial [Anaerolineales bacterium]|nr:twin-arginine translocation signal domain-containing protein [Anaerolineales bacterium]